MLITLILQILRVTNINHTSFFYNSYVIIVTNQLKANILILQTKFTLWHTVSMEHEFPAYNK